MSIAVRVSVWILGGLVVISAAVAVLTLLQKQTLQGQYQSLQHQVSEKDIKLADLTTQAKKLQDTVDQLNTKVTQAQQDKTQVQSQFDDLKHKSDDLQSQLEQANTDRNDLKTRIATVSRDRDNLLWKFKHRPLKYIYKDRIVKVPAVSAPAAEDSGLATAAPVVDVTSAQGDEYWAAVLRQKASLQVELDKEKSDLDQAALQVVDLKKQNSDLELQVKELSNDKDEIVQKIKYGQDLADNLSIDLARSRNDQKAVNDRADKLKEENMDLQSQIRDLSSSKLDLEKTISRLTDDKDAMQKKLIETESVIQSRIDDIWKIKEGLDKKLSENTTSSSSGSVDLPPIVVNASNSQQQAAASSEPNPAVAQPSETSGKTQGTIISINEANNFVIVDLGQDNSSVNIGSPLKVYRDSEPIATLEVIQLRKDICAADIKDKYSELKVGDTVKFSNP